MKITQQERLDGVTSFKNFLLNHTAQARMILSGKNGDELIETISEIAKLASKASMATFRDGGEKTPEKDAAGKIVSVAEQLSRLNHQVASSIGMFWADQTSSLFKLLAGMDPDVMFKPLATITRDESGEPTVQAVEGVDPKTLEEGSLKPQVDGSLSLMKANPTLQGVVVAIPAQEIIDLLSFLSTIRGSVVSFEEHQNTTEIPEFINGKSEVAKFAYMVITYFMSVITSYIGHKDVITSTSIGTMSMARTMSDLLLSPITPVPESIKIEDIIRQLCNSTFEDFAETYSIRNKASAVNEAMQKVAKGEITKEDFSKLYGELKNKPAEEESGDKFVFAAPASVQ